MDGSQQGNAYSDLPRLPLMRPVDIDAVWHLVAEPAAKAFIGDITPEDIKQECREGRAMACVCPDGIVVCKLLPRRHREHEFDLLVMLAVSFSGHGAFEREMPEVEALARELGAKRLRFSSPRTGWLRKASKSWQFESATYVRDL